MSGDIVDSNAAAMPHPGVRFPPPILFLTGFVIGWLIETRVGRLPLIGEGSAPRNVQMLASLVTIAGFGLVAWGMLTFARARTAILPFRPATHIVDTGPYAFTRNPMYTGLTIAYAGFAWLLNMGWPLLLLPLVLLALYALVIRREERYLLSAFGPNYEQYRSRVRRWF